jgi:hypothetical protein
MDGFQATAKACNPSPLKKKQKHPSLPSFLDPDQPGSGSEKNRRRGQKTIKTIKYARSKKEGVEGGGGTISGI